MTEPIDWTAAQHAVTEALTKAPADVAVYVHPALYLFARTFALEHKLNITVVPSVHIPSPEQSVYNPAPEAEPLP